MANPNLLFFIILFASFPKLSLANDIKVVNETALQATSQSNDLRTQLSFSSRRFQQPIVVDIQQISAENLESLQKLSPAKLESYFNMREFILTQAFNTLHTFRGPIGYGYTTKTKINAFYNKLRGREAEVFSERIAASREFIESALKGIDQKLAERSEVVANSKHVGFALTINAGLAKSLPMVAKAWGKYYGLTFVLNYNKETETSYFEVLTYKEAVKSGFVANVGAKIYLGLRLETENEGHRTGEVLSPLLVPLAISSSKKLYEVAITAGVVFPPPPFSLPFYYNSDFSEQRLVNLNISFFSPKFIFFKTRDVFSNLYTQARTAVINTCKRHF